MSVSVSQSGSGNAVSQRFKQLEKLGQTGNDSLFEVTNLLTGVQTHVPGGVVGRFLNGDYTAIYAGENKPNAAQPATEADAQATADAIIAEAQAKADAILAAAQKTVDKVSKMKKGAE